MNSILETPTSEDTKQGEELVKIAENINAIRKGLRPVPSDRAWVKLWPGLGSPKTWSNILRGDLAGRAVSTQLLKYRGVLNTLEANSKERADEEYYTDLAPAEVVSLTALRLARHHGKDRLMLVMGGSGSGKTTSLELLKSGPLAGMITILEADETWKSLRAALGDVLEAMGVSEKTIPSSTAGRQRLLLESIKQRGRVMIAIDEAHHCTGSVLNCLKTILNRTECLLILAGMDTLLRKLRHISSEESKQLFHNRLFAKVELSTPDQAGAALFISRRLSGGSWKKGTLQQVVKTASNSGHWAFLRRVTDLLLDEDLTGAKADDISLLQATTDAKNEVS